eukprot:scaffold113773_cov35-Tisochrysis_lutea.AAC.1
MSSANRMPFVPTRTTRRDANNIASCAAGRGHLLRCAPAHCSATHTLSGAHTEYELFDPCEPRESTPHRDPEKKFP